MLLLPGIKPGLSVSYVNLVPGVLYPLPATPLRYEKTLVQAGILPPPGGVAGSVDKPRVRGCSQTRVLTVIITV